MSDIYEEAVADAKKLREKATQVVEQRLVEKFRPKIDRYIAQALLEDADDAEGDAADDEEEDILLGVDLADDAAGAGADVGDAGEDIARDVEASIEGEEGEDAAMSLNTDGTVTLDMDKLVVPEESAVESVAAGEPAVPAAGGAAASAETLMAGDVKESLRKLETLKKLAEGVDDQFAAFGRLSRAYDSVFTRLAPSDMKELDKPAIAGLTELAERINESYIFVRESGSIEKGDKEGLLIKFEGTYARVNDVLTEAVCTRIAKRIARIEGDLSKFNNLNEASRRTRGSALYQEVDGLCRILEAVADRTGSSKVSRMKDRIATVVEEIKNMTRKPLNEDEVVLKLELPDDETKDAVLDALGGEEGGDEDMDALLGDEGGDEDEGGDDLDLEGDDMMGGSEPSMGESSAAADLARLFEDDDQDAGDDDVDLTDLGDWGGDDGGDVDGDEGDESGDKAASTLEKVAGVLRGAHGDVEIEIVDDEYEGGDDLDLEGAGMYEDDSMYEGDESDDEDMVDEGDDVGDDADSGDMVEVDMRDVAKALSEMDSSYHKHDMPGPEAGLDDFGGATESSEPFVDDEELAEARRRRHMKRRKQERMSEGRSPSTPTAREVAAMRRKLAEAKRKQRDNNLLSAKLLYINKLLQRSDLTAEQRTRIVNAMDEAGNLREARLLYKNLTRAFEKRKGRLSEGRHRLVGSASQVTTSGGFNRESRVSEHDSVLNESIDLDLWRRTAGID